MFYFIDIYYYVLYNRYYTSESKSPSVTLPHLNGWKELNEIWQAVGYAVKDMRNFFPEK